MAREVVSKRHLRKASTVSGNFKKCGMLIEKYTSNWIKDFTDIGREIDYGLYGLEYSIEHVGVNDFIDSIIEKEKTKAQHRLGNMAAKVLP